MNKLRQFLQYLLKKLGGRPPATPTVILERVKFLLREPDRWGKGAFALTQDGQKRSPHSQHAYRFCLAGALERATEESTVRDRFTLYYELLNACSELLYAAADDKIKYNSRGFNQPVLIRINDHPETTYHDIHALLDRAIELARK